MSRSLREVISDRLAELGRNPFEAARLAGLERGYLNDILIEKKTSIRDAKIPQVATALDWTPAELMLGLGRLAPEAVISVGARVSVQGRIGAGQQILPEYEQMPPDGLYQIEVMLTLPDDAIAFEVTGESMWPRYDEGDIVICRNRTVDPVTVIGWEAAVRTIDGHRYLKRILQGEQRDTFTLESHNAKAIREVKLDWISPIEHVVRAGQWQKLSPRQRAHQIQKAAAQAPKKER